MLRTAIQRPIATSMFFLALCLLGAIGYSRIPVDLLPSITHPRLTVVTTLTDVPAVDVERLVTEPIEQVVTALPGVRRVVSRSREGLSLVTVEHEWGTGMDFANLRLREAVDRVAFRRDFPEDAERPAILRWDPTSRPIATLVLEGTDRLAELTAFAVEVVKPALEQVGGISQAEVIGGVAREILVEPDPKKLAIHGVGIEEIRRALEASNISFPGGKIRRGPLHLSLRIAGEFERIEEIAETEIPREGKRSIRVSDLARVFDGTEEPEGVTLLGPDPVVSLLIYKEPEANTIQVTDDMDRALEVVRDEAGEFAYRFVVRDAEFVRASFQGLLQSLVIGAFLAFFVLFLFLNDARSPLVVGVAIPVSILVTFGFLSLGGVKLNLMSLGGLSLAAGMLVDSSIVVLENINRHLSGAQGPDVRRLAARAAERGTAEVSRAVLASTLTTIAVFFPVVYVPGVAGAFFRDQALTVTFSLAVSVAVALLLQPMLASRLLAVPGPPTLVFRASGRVLEWARRAHHALLLRALTRPVPALVGLGVVLVAAFAVGLGLERRFMPERSSGDFGLDVELPAGTPLAETSAFASALAAWIGADENVRAVFSQVGRTESTLAAIQDYAAPNTIRQRVVLGPVRGAARAGRELRRELDTHLGRFPGVTARFREEGIGLGELLADSDAPVSLGVVAEDPDDAIGAATEIAARLEEIDGVRDVTVDRVFDAPNVVVRLNREAIYRHGLDPDRVALEVRNRIGGVRATSFNEIDERIDVAVRLAPDTRRSLRAAMDAPMKTRAGESVALGSLLDLDEDRPVRELVRRDQRRMVTVRAELTGGRSLRAVTHDVERIAEDTPLGGGVRVVESGEREAVRDSFRSLAWAMLLAIALVYMILAAQFESFLDPFLIAAVVPIGLAGAVLAVFISGGSINVLSLIGTLALLGISVNDAIVKVDTIRRLRADGREPTEAILEGSALRFRPILMTSVTTVLAMLPMAIGLGSGEQLQRPLAVTIIGGLTLTTAITLVYTPLLYALAHRIRLVRAPEPTGHTA